MSGTLKKLRYRPGMRVCVLGAPAAFEVEVRGAKQLSRARKLEKGLDLVQAFFTRRAHLVKDLPKLKASLAEKGLLWLCYPKGKALGTDLNRDLIRACAARAGLEGVAIVAIDEVWSALRVKVV